MDHSADKELTEWLHWKTCERWRTMMNDVCRGSLLEFVLFNTLLVMWTMKLSAPSANVRMIPSWVTQSTQWKVRMPSRGTLWWSWEVVLHEPHEIQEDRESSSAHGPGKSQKWMQTWQWMDWEQPWGEDLGVKKKKNMMSDSVHLQLRKLVVSWVKKIKCGQRWGRWLSLSTPLSWDPICSIVFSSKVPNIWEVLSLTWSREGQWKWSEGWSTSPIKMDWEGWIYLA